MFDVGWSELLVIGIVALIAIGPKELPGVLRSVGHWMGKVRRMASDFQDQFREAMREAEVADLKKQFDDVSGAANNLTSSFDNPLDTARKEVEKALGEEPASAGASETSATPPGTDTAAAVDQTAATDDKAAETKPKEAAHGGGGPA